VATKYVVPLFRRITDDVVEPLGHVAGRQMLDPAIVIDAAGDITVNPYLEMTSKDAEEVLKKKLEEDREAAEKARDLESRVLTPVLVPKGQRLKLIVKDPAEKAMKGKSASMSAEKSKQKITEDLPAPHTPERQMIRNYSQDSGESSMASNTKPRSSQDSGRSAGLSE
jgi:hypothetical protein